MAKFTGKNNFANGDTITFTSLNDITDTLEIATDSFTSTFNVTSGLVSINSGAITTDLIETSSSDSTGVTTAKIADDAIITAKLPDSTSTTDGVTYAKIQYVSDAGKLLGRTTASSGVVEEVDIDTDLSVVSVNDDTIPSAKAVKSYVDSAPNHVPSTVDDTTRYTQLPNGLIMKFGQENVTGTQTTITFDSTVAFSTLISVVATAVDSDSTPPYPVSINSASTTQVIIDHSADIASIYYQAIGE
ncbi:tail fiber protein [Phage C75C1]|nr:tail fiber protein [Phage C75C1]